MPITENGYEYSIPQEWKDIIDLNFLKQFREELFKLKYISLGSFYQDTTNYYGGTSGWDVALKLTCINTNKVNLYKYYRTLPWYDSDLFDYDLSEMLMESNIIMKGSFVYVISEKLNIKEEDIMQCGKCGIYDYKHNMVEDKEIEDLFSCMHCNDFDSHKYYLDGLNKECE